MALPVAAGQRAPAADRRPGGGQRRAAATATGSTPAARGCVHADRVRRRRLPVRAQHGPALVPRELHQRHRRQHQPDRRPVLRAGVRPQRARLQRPGPHDRADLLGGYPGAAALHRLADVLRSRRRPGQEQQEDRHHDLERAVHPAAARDRAAHPDRPDRAAAAQPAAPAHLGPALRAGHRPRDAASRRSAEPTSPTSPRVYAPFATSTPLWYYILAEAKAHGRRAAPRPGRRPDRRRDADRPAARRSDQLPERPPPLPAVPRRRPRSSGRTPTRTSPATAPTPARTSSTTPASSRPAPTDERDDATGCSRRPISRSSWSSCCSSSAPKRLPPNRRDPRVQRRTHRRR